MTETTINATRPLEIRLFGRMEVFVRGEPLPQLRSRRGYYLLALLALRHSRGETPRSHFAGLLWPDSDEEMALSSLRRALTDLRGALGPEAERLCAPSPRTLLLDLSCDALADVVAFDHQMARATTAAREEAVALYRGELLTDCTEDWVAQERIAREQTVLDALESLAEEALASDHAHDALRHLRQAVVTDPLRETAQRGLLRALAAVGDYANVTATYRELRLRLRNDLNTEPSRETQELYQRLRSDGRSGVPPAAPRPIAPVPVASAVPIRVPRPLTPLIGRSREVEEITSALRGTRLMTLTGSGGVGKTRLSLQIAEEVAADFADGVYFADLTDVKEPEHLVPTLAAALEIAQTPNRPIREALIEQIRTKQILLVLDNCEQIIEACARTAMDLLRACSRLQILATSRQPLGLPGEITWRVPSLEVPSPDRLSTDAKTFLEEVNRSEAVVFFATHARAATGIFVLTPQNAPAVLQICRQLDGIPLAMELAAARVRALTPEQIAARLNDRFHLLHSTSTVLSRRQTLRGTIDWSCDLLSPTERSLLYRLSVFAGGWSLEAVEAVCGEPMAATDQDAFTTLLQLVDKSLVVVDDTPTGRRYRLLETLRQYGQEHLQESGEKEATQERHYLWCLQLVEDARRGPIAQYQKQIEAEQDNLRVALRWAEGSERLAQLVGVLWRFWEQRGNCIEGRYWTERALAQSANPAGDPKLHAYLLRGFSAFAWRQGDLQAAFQAASTSLSLYESAGDTLCMAQLNLVVATMCLGREEIDKTMDHLAESERLFSLLGDKKSNVSIFINRGNVYLGRGDVAGANDQYTAAAKLASEMNDVEGLLIAWGNLAATALEEKDYDSAERLWRLCLEKNIERNHPFGIANTTGHLGHVALFRGNRDESERLLLQALTLGQQLGDAHLLVHALAGLGMLALHDKRPERATYFYAARARLYERMAISEPNPAGWSEEKQIRTELGEIPFANAWTKGASMTMDQLAAYASTQNNRV